MITSNLKDKIEPFIYKKLQKNKYEILILSPIKLLTWNRLDLAFKLFYLNNLKINPELALKIYREDIKAQTLGEFTEYGNELLKNNFDTYIKSFLNTLNNIEENGFDKKKTLIPLSSDQSLINGSHRVSSAIYLEKEVYCITTEADKLVADYKYFFERNVSEDILDMVTREFIKYSKDNIYIAFLWPSGKNNKEKSIECFSNIVYQKEISLSAVGGFNLLVELYKHMDWVGNYQNNFAGAKQKLIECFPSFERFTVIVFQEKNLDEVQKIKAKVRKIHNIGFSSVHITDTQEEAIRISNLILNDNGLQFLNYANPYKYSELHKNIENFKSFLINNKIDIDSILIDGSVILTLYGLRKNADIDFLMLENNLLQKSHSNYELHDSELKYHQQSKEELITNPKYYFKYLGLKFVSLNQLYNMKKKRNEEKDKNDCSLMKSLLENNKKAKIIAKYKQKVLYFKIKTKTSMRVVMSKVLKDIGLYNSLRYIYRLMKGRK